MHAHSGPIHNASMLSSQTCLPSSITVVFELLYLLYHGIRSFGIYPGSFIPLSLQLTTTQLTSAMVNFKVKVKIKVKVLKTVKPHPPSLSPLVLTKTRNVSPFMDPSKLRILHTETTRQSCSIFYQLKCMSTSGFATSNIICRTFSLFFVSSVLHSK